MLTLRMSTPGDVAELAALELAADTGQWLGETGRAWHERALADPDQEHLAAGEPGALRGFAVLAGLGHRDGGIELRRMVVAAPFRGSGQGRALLRAALTRACCHHRARRVWLDVKPGNLRARSLYESEGFTVVALPAHGPDPRGATGLVVMERACPGE